MDDHKTLYHFNNAKILVKKSLKMKRILASLFVCLALFGCKEKKENHLTIATSADYPPLEFFKDGEIVGMEIDLIRAIAKELNYSTTIKDMSFDSIIGALQTERVDLAISGISATSERKEKVDFAIPHHKDLLAAQEDNQQTPRSEGSPSCGRTTAQLRQPHRRGPPG